MSKNVNFRYRSEVPKSIDLGSISGVPKGVHFGIPKGTKFIAFPLDQCQKMENHCRKLPSILERLAPSKRTCFSL